MFFDFSFVVLFFPTLWKFYLFICFLNNKKGCGGVIHSRIIPSAACCFGSVFAPLWMECILRNGRKWEDWHGAGIVHAGPPRKVWVLSAFKSQPSPLFFLKGGGKKNNQSASDVCHTKGFRFCDWRKPRTWYKCGMEQKKKKILTLHFNDSATFALTAAY